jgi:hypothetical protein
MKHGQHALNGSDFSYPCLIRVSSVAKNSAFRISDFPLRSQMLSQQIGALILPYLFKDLSIG